MRSAGIGESDIAAGLVEQPQDTHVRVEFDVPRGATVLRLAYTGGVSIVPVTPRPVIGEASRSMKIVSVRLKDRVYTIEIDRAVAEPGYFELRTPWKIDSVQGAKFEALTPSSYRLTIDATQKRSQVLVTFT
jgi:hypothetical protein